MPVAERTLTVDEYRAGGFEPFSSAPFWGVLDGDYLLANKVDHVVVVDFVGAFEGLEAREFPARIARLVERGERIVVVNVEALTRIDSEGLGELIRALVHAVRAGRRMPMVNVPKHLRELIALYKFL